MTDPGRPRRIVVDTDPGLDDAVALWLALGPAELETVAVLADEGKVGLDRMLVNACAIVTMEGRVVPVRLPPDQVSAARPALIVAPGCCWTTRRASGRYLCAQAWNAAAE